MKGDQGRDPGISRIKDVTRSCETRPKYFNAMAYAGFNGLAGILGIAILWAFSGCSSTPVRFECGEQRFRLANEDLSEDQRRFAEEALRDCESRLQVAAEKDSTFVDGLNERFTPKDSL